MILPAIAIKQPWASLIIHGGKDIENRTWPTKMRGRVLVHASKQREVEQWVQALDLMADRGMSEFTQSLLRESLPCGGIIGTAEIVDCVTESDSPWFVGQYGFVLANPKPLPFVACRGALGFFGVDYPDLERFLNESSVTQM